jgi:hypothetical protein
MQHFLVILLGLYLGIGLLLLRIGPLSHLMHETRQDGLGSSLLLGLFLLLLWPCLWPTAVYRPQFGASMLTFDRAGWVDPADPVDQVDADIWSPSSAALASTGRPSGTADADGSATGTPAEERLR